jgi:hypothetical protein
MRNAKYSEGLALLLAPVVGLLAFVLPVFILSPKQYESPLFPLLRTGIEGASSLTYILLFLGALGLGTALRISPWLLGVFCMAGFPLLAFAEMVYDPSSHNLWPIEFLIYAGTSVVSITGAFVGDAVRELFSKTEA